MVHSLVLNRTKKPFNSLLGETCDYEHDGLRVIAEQVSHHPPISAYYAETKDFIIEGYTGIQLVFSMNGFAIRSTGKSRVFLKKFNEKYLVKFPDNEFKNLIKGNMYILHVGKLIVTEERSEIEVNIDFPQLGWFKEPDYAANGFVFDEQKNKKFEFLGRWNDHCEVVDLSTNQKTPLCSMLPYLDSPEKQYYFNEMSLRINHLSQEMV